LSLSNVRPIALPASASGQVGPQGVDFSCSYRGFSIREQTGSAACVIRIRDGGVITGNVLDTISLAAGESTGDEYAEGRRADKGFYVQLVSGTMPEGTLFYS
jgi:hypothetical protein